MSKHEITCSSCKKPLVAGAFPKWFCLHQDCDNYLKPQTDLANNITMALEETPQTISDRYFKKYSLNTEPLNTIFVVAFIVAFCAALCLSAYFSLQSNHYANKLQLTQDSLRVERSHVRLLEANMKILNRDRYK